VKTIEKACTTLGRFARLGAVKVGFQPASTNTEHVPMEVEPTTEDVKIVGIVVRAIVGTPRTTD